jgi:hypothetical protein
MIVRDGAPAPTLRAGGVAVEGVCVRRCNGWRAILHRFSQPFDEREGYLLDGERFAVRANVEGDLRVAYVSCNGQEHGDTDRPSEDRNTMWARLAASHRESPFHLLLQGGDQLYADEAARAHPLTAAWRDGETVPADIAPDAMAEIAETLDRAYFERYLHAFGQPETARLLAEVPSLAIWDDHDIVDGWGSLPAERLDTPLGRLVFETARAHFLLFQRGLDPAEVEGAATLSWHVSLPGLDILAPDLRSERRPDRVLGPEGWRHLRRGLDASMSERILLLSSVPALGPRLSWIEALMGVIPGLQKYEDDLRDQWQSHAHRAEWRALLSAIAARHGRGDARVTVLSGEIHLATRAEMAHEAGPIHQLVASGVAHPAPPRLYARALGGLARLGEAPLPAHPIRLHPLPGQRPIYTDERNVLILERTSRHWSARWDLEHSGLTPALEI